MKWPQRPPLTRASAGRPEEGLGRARTARSCHGRARRTGAYAEGGKGKRLAAAEVEAEAEEKPKVEVEAEVKVEVDVASAGAICMATEGAPEASGRENRA
jgi:hypothetical protein